MPKLQNPLWYDTLLGAQGASISDSRLRELAITGAWYTKSPRVWSTVNPDALVSANLQWVDYASGVTSNGAIWQDWNHVFGVPIAYALYHQASDKTYRQPTITLDSRGRIISLPGVIIEAGNTTGILVTI